MFEITKGITHFYQHIYLELVTEYYKYMLDEFIKYIGMYHNSFKIDIMLNI